MRRRLISTGAALLLACIPLMAQDNDVRFNGNFMDVPFVEFIEEIEAETEVRFYFREKWISGIRITAMGEDLSLKRILDKALLPAGISCFIDKTGGIYLSIHGAMLTVLPDYTRVAELRRLELPDDGEEELSSAEKRYMEGRRAGMLETLRLGRNDAGNGGRSAVIHGKISDLETGEALIGATIYFEELKKGAASDVDGRFILVVPTGTYTVNFNCMGMKDQRAYLEVLSGGDLDISMEKSLISLTEVTVQANRYHNVRGTQMGFERLNYKVLNEVPVIMGEKDILKVVQMLPGVQSVGEGAAGFNVRGSAADQNMIYVNKVPVYNINHLFGFFTSFSPDIVKDFTLYKSNLPASFGGRLASFFDISTRQGNMNHYTVRGGVSPITARLAVEGPIKKDKSSFVLSGRSTYSDWILKRLEDPALRNSDANFYDLAGILTWEPDEKTLIKAFAYYSNDKFKLGEFNQYAYSNTGASLNVRRRMGLRSNGELALVYGSYNFSTVDENIPSESYSHAYRIDHYEIKTDLSWLSMGKHKISYGANAIYYQLNRGIVMPYGKWSYRSPLDLGIENGVETGIYVADEIAVFPWLTLYAGLRFSAFAALGPSQVLLYNEGQARLEANVVDTLNFGRGEISSAYQGLEPRVSLKFMTGDNSSIKMSYNRMRQFMFMLSNTIAMSPSDQWKLCDYHISPPYVDQISLGYYKDFPGMNISTSLETYYKWVSDVVEYRDGANFISSPHVETQTLQGEQTAYGVEMMIKKNSGRLSGWVAYSYSRSLMQMASSLPGESINQGNIYPSNYDRPHNLNVVTNLKLNRRLSLSANMVYITGRPVTYPISIYYSEGMEYIDYSDRNAYRIPDYFRVDLSVNLEGNLKERKLFHSYWMLNFYNLTGRSNAYSVYFQNDNGVIKGYKLSIFGQMIVTLSWNFKLGNYASE